MSVTKVKTETIYGRNPVNELLRAGRRRVVHIKVVKGAQERGLLGEVLSRAREAGIPIKQVERRELDRVSEKHQGLAAETSTYPYLSIHDILELARAQGEDPFVLILDLLQDPQNLGALLRSAEATGVHGVLLPPRRAVGVTPAVVSASAGASEHILVAIGNIAQGMQLLKEEGLWLVGLDADEDAQPFDQIDLKGPVGLVVGSEGDGMRPLVRRHCDLVVRIPMRGRIGSLNAAVAGSIMLYGIRHARDWSGSAGADPQEPSRGSR